MEFLVQFSRSVSRGIGGALCIDGRQGVFTQGAGHLGKFEQLLTRLGSASACRFTSVGFELTFPGVRKASPNETR